MKYCVFKKFQLFLFVISCISIHAKAQVVEDDLDNFKPRAQQVKLTSQSLIPEEPELKWWQEDNTMNSGISFSVGWVAKQWVGSNKNGEKIRGDLWRKGSMLNGLQVGFNFQKVLKSGIGCRTGLFYEWYTSSNSVIKEIGWDRFNEHNLYVPIHLLYSIPIAKNFSIIPSAGVGFNWAIYGDYKNGARMKPGNSWGLLIADVLTGNYYNFLGSIPMGDNEKILFNYNNNTPHHWNVQAELGLTIMLARYIKLSGSYAFGLNRHKLYGYDVRGDKFNVMLGIHIPFNERD